MCNLVKLQPLTLVLLFALSSCTATSHNLSKKSAPGTPNLSQNDVLKHVSQPGTIKIQRLTVADWKLKRKGLINLKHPRSKEAKLKNTYEDVHLYIYILEHPTQGTFFIDSGVASNLTDPDADDYPVKSPVVRKALNFKEFKLLRTTADVIQEHGAPNGVFLTHIHIDHIMGVPDLPKNTPLFIGPHETSHREAKHLGTRGTLNRFLDGAQPFQTLPFPEHEEEQPFSAVDLFGDQQVFAIHTPGHTPGSLAFLIRTENGPILLTGDTSHTAWGWDNCVAPGLFNSDIDETQKDLEMLKAIEEKLPNLTVWTGHQSLSTPRSNTNRCN